MKFEQMPELKDVVVSLKNAFPEKLEHIDEDRILYANFSKKESRTKGKIGRVPPRYSIFLKNYDYLLEVHKESWLLFGNAERLYVILHELCHIPDGGFDSEQKSYRKVIKHDLEDFKMLVREYGVDWENLKKLEDIVK